MLEQVKTVDRRVGKRTNCVVFNPKLRWENVGMPIVARNLTSMTGEVSLDPPLERMHVASGTSFCCATTAHPGGAPMTYPESFDHMLAAWNERDPARVRGHLDKALAPDVEFIDPSVVTHGIDEFEANVHQVKAGLPGAEYSRTSGVDSHHQLHRYSWQIRRDGEVILPGFDVTEVDEQGKVKRVLGFFGPLPDKD